jgi:magnesium-transporting ATPase (P-type)
MLYGVEVKMITGDHLLIAMETAKQLDLGDRVPGSDIVQPYIKTATGAVRYNILFAINDHSHDPLHTFPSWLTCFSLLAWNTFKDPSLKNTFTFSIIPLP